MTTPARRWSRLLVGNNGTWAIEGTAPLTDDEAREIAQSFFGTKALVLRKLTSKELALVMREVNGLYDQHGVALLLGTPPGETKQ